MSIKFSHIYKRIIFHILKFSIKLISYFNHRLYMKLYVPLLKFNGMNITGTPRYIGKDVVFDSFSKIYLGERVVISNDCHLLTHDYSITTALIAINRKPQTDLALVREIKIGKNVFIGKKSIIMPNTTIGNNVIIGAGSVVRGTIKNNSIVMGNPAKVVGDITQLVEKWEHYLSTDKIRKD